MTASSYAGFALILSALLFGSPLSMSTAEPGAAKGVARPAPDTIGATVISGESLVHSLPPTLEGRDVVEYRMIRGPILSGVADRSFTWITKDVRPGNRDVLLKALYSDAAPDTLVLRVEVQPND